MKLKKINWKLMSCLVTMAIFLLWISYPLWSYLYKNAFYNTEFSEMGVFGDSFGALNTLFSGLAFTGIIVSIFIQSEELKTTRKDIQDQVEQFKKQTEALKLQVFENTFFNMLKLHGDIVEAAKAEKNKEKYSGRMCFYIVYGEFLGHQGRFYSLKESEALKTVCDAYEFLHESVDALFGHYFRNIYQIINFVDESELSDEQKKRYIDILSAQFSTYENVFLFFHCLSRYGCETHKHLVEKYGMLEHLSVQKVLNIIKCFCPENNSLVIITMYQKKAYGILNAQALEFYK